MASVDNTSGRFALTLVELLVSESSDPKSDERSAAQTMKNYLCRSFAIVKENGRVVAIAPRSESTTGIVGAPNI